MLQLNGLKHYLLLVELCQFANHRLPKQLIKFYSLYDKTFLKKKHSHTISIH